MTYSFAINTFAKATMATITVNSVKELKEKIKAFEILFGRTPEVYFGVHGGDNVVTSKFDNEMGEVYEGYAYYGLIEDCKSFEIKKYIMMDNGLRLNIKSETEITLY